MADGEGPPDWDPERERRQTDPVEAARAVARVMAEEQEKFEARRRVAMPPPPPPDLQLAIHPIANGYIIAHSVSAKGLYPSERAPIEEYAKDQEAVTATVNRIVREFFIKLHTGPAAPSTASPVTGQGLEPVPAPPGSGSNDF